MAPEPSLDAHSSTAGSATARGAAGARAGQYLCSFWLRGRCYAIDAVLVAEVVAVPKILPVPLTPPWLLGLHNLRGTVLALVDLAAVLDLPQDGPERTPGPGATVLVLRTPEVLVGARIERVDAVQGFETTRVEPLAAEGHPYVKALVRFDTRGGQVATLLDEVKVGARLSGLRLRKNDEKEARRRAALAVGAPGKERMEP